MLYRNSNWNHVELLNYKKTASDTKQPRGVSLVPVVPMISISG